MQCWIDDVLIWMHDSVGLHVWQPAGGQHRLVDIFPAAVGPWRFLSTEYQVQSLLPARDVGMYKFFTGMQLQPRLML